jgi:hypothetical protein
MIGDVIYNLLSNDATVSGLVGLKIYPYLGTENIVYPYIIYDQTTLQPTDTKDGVSELDTISYDVEIYTKSPSELTSIANAVRNVLDRYNGTVNTKLIDSIRYLDENSGFSLDDRVYLRIQNYSIRYKKIDLETIIDLVGVANGTTQIDLTWSNITSNAGYRIERSLDLITWSSLVEVATDTVSYSNTGLTIDTTYFYRIRAFNSNESAAWSNIVGVSLVNVLTPSGIAYQRPQLTGQTTSYRTGDDAWRVANMPYAAAPANPTHIATLVDFFTLAANNALGNTLRFTDQSGAAAVDAGGLIISSDTLIDHYTGLEHAVNNAQTGNNKNWNTAIDECLALNVQGFDDWYLPNASEELSVAYYKGKSDSLTLIAGIGARSFWTSTTQFDDTLRALRYNNTTSANIILQGNTKTGNMNYIPIRQRY